MHVHQPKNPSPPIRRDIHRLDDWHHDPYVVGKKWPQPTYCPDCNLSYRNTLWRREPVPEGAEAHRCPACLRIRDRCPAAYLTLSGEFFRQHQDEIIQRVELLAEDEFQRYPLNRMMSREDDGEHYVIQYTEPNSARNTGYDLQSIYQGRIRIAYDRDAYMVRVFWTR
ncbi:MAG: hypothetical protein RLZZ226_687 [Pseudomonadota bacterium]|jgi:hypothetical protein